MRSHRSRARLICLSIFLLFAILASLPRFRSAVRASRLDLQAVAHGYPNFTREQHLAILQEMQAKRYPRWRDLSKAQVLERMFALAMASGSSSTMAPAANFEGNMTAVSVANGDLMALAQQSDCSLTLRDAPYTFNYPGPLASYTLNASTPHYEQLLHNAAGLTTTSGKYPAGCGNATAGTASRNITSGVTSSGKLIGAIDFYDLTSGQDQVMVTVAASDDTFQTFTSLAETNNAASVAAADLNGDGNSDLILVNNPLASGSATVSISLGSASGTFPIPTEIPIAGNNAYSVVVDDFNGDGKLDIVASTSSPSGASGETYYINFLAGNGDGTFKAVKTYTFAPPSLPSAPYFALISADLRGIGHKDLISSTGLVLFGNGDGTFTQPAMAGFPYPGSSNSGGPASVIAGDFNKDGKIDLAVNNGVEIQIFLGKGDGTFTLRATYATISNEGYLEAQDIDGDGNIDLFSGGGNGGSLGGDKYGFNLGYALMGNGDGTFRGAPLAPFIYTGTNLADLNGDKTLDGVQVSSNGMGSTSFASYLGDGKGNFTYASTLDVSTIQLNGHTYTVYGIDSFGVADVNGDGFADLVYVASNFNGPSGPGIFIATGKGDGSFNAPVFVPAPTFVAAPDTQGNTSISGLRLADMNHDGVLDLVYTYATSSAIQNKYLTGIAVQLGNGDGTFKNVAEMTQLYAGSTQANPGVYQIGLIGDANQDGFSDLFVLNVSSSTESGLTTQIFLGKGDGTFKAPATIAGIMSGGIQAGTQQASITLADMNNDGIPDIVSSQNEAYQSKPVLAIALGNGDGTFKTPTQTQYPGGTIAVADFNGDGKLDVAIITGTATSNGILFGNGDGTLQTATDSAGSVSPSESLYLTGTGGMIAVDLNGDGKPDILSGNVELLSQSANVVSLPASTTSLTASAPSLAAGQSETFTAMVVSASGSTGTPTGTVTFLDGTTSLGIVSLDTKGDATFATTALAPGTHSISAQYSGDSNFAASTSSAVAVTITALVPDFSLAISPASGTESSSSAANATLTLTPVNGFNSIVSFACSGLPAGISCSFSPSTLTPAGSPITTTVTFSGSASALMDARPASRPPTLFLLSFSFGAWLFARSRKRRSFFRSMGAILGMAVLCSVLGCGHGSQAVKATSTTSTVTITATSGAILHSATYSLTSN
jgi:hypothetical protein